MLIDSVVYKEIDVTGVNQENDSYSLSVYPNPVSSGKVTVESKFAEPINIAELTDLQGKIVRIIYPDQSKAALDVSSVKEGMYFLRIHTGSSIRCRKILILE